MTPNELTDHPDFPKHLDGVNKTEYAVMVDKYWINERKRKMADDQPDQNSDSAKKRKVEDFSEEEQQTVFDQRVLLAISKETVAECHDSEVGVINEIILNHNLKQQRKNANFKQKMMKGEDGKEALAESLKMIGTFNCDLCHVQCPGMDFFISRYITQTHQI